jgi:hypothetical protein
MAEGREKGNSWVALAAKKIRRPKVSVIPGLAP